MYLAKFDKNGNRTETHISAEYTDEQKSQMYADGFVDLSEDDWNYYVGNMGTGDNGTGYIKDAETGKPVSAPPAPKPSKTQRIFQLERDFESAKTELSKTYLEAVMNNDTDTQKDIQVELDAIKAQFEDDVNTILNEEE